MTEKKRKGQPPPRYDEAFRQGAIRLVTEQNRSPQEVAQELGICVDTMKAWLRRAGAPSGGAKNSEAVRFKALEAENRALKKALAEEKEAVEILKKSLGIISKP
jgi:transposase